MKPQRDLAASRQKGEVHLTPKKLWGTNPQQDRIASRQQGKILRSRKRSKERNLNKIEHQIVKWALLQKRRLRGSERPSGRV